MAKIKTFSFEAPAVNDGESENEYLDRCQMENDTEDETERRNECQLAWDNSQEDEDSDNDSDGPPEEEGSKARSYRPKIKSGLRGGSMEIKEIKQNQADLTIESGKLRADARAIMDRPMDEEARTVGLRPIEDRLASIDLDQGTLATNAARYERYREEELGGASARTGADSPHISGVRVGPAHGGAGEFGELGEFLQAVVAADRGDAHMRETLINNYDHSNPVLAAAFGAGIGQDDEGGFLVQTDHSGEIRQVMHDIGTIFGEVTPLPLTGPADSISLNAVDETSRADGSRFGGVQGFWVDEGNAPTATRPRFRQVELKLRKLMALGYATSELLQHVAAMTVMFGTAFAEELLFKVEDALYEGDGVGKPRGILNSPATISVSKESGQDASTVTHGNLRDMWARLHPRSRANAKWYINVDVEPSLDDLAKIIGISGIEPNYVTYGPTGVMSIKGRPVVPIEYASTLGTIGDIMLADFSQYAFIERGPIDQQSSMHIRFATDEMAFRASFRCDGESFWKTALTPFKGTATQSPFIKLASRL